MHRERRDEVRQLRLLAASGTDPVTAPFTDRVEDAVAARSVKQRLAAAVAELPVNQRDALLLLVWAGLSYEQIATATGVPLGLGQPPVGHNQGAVVRPDRLGLGAHAILRKVTSIDGAHVVPSALASWCATWVEPSSVIVAVQRVRSLSHLITSPSTSIREACTLPKLS